MLFCGRLTNPECCPGGDQAARQDGAVAVRVHLHPDLPRPRVRDRVRVGAQRGLGLQAALLLLHLQHQRELPRPLGGQAAHHRGGGAELRGDILKVISLINLWAMSLQTHQTMIPMNLSNNGYSNA